MFDKFPKRELLYLINRPNIESLTSQMLPAPLRSLNLSSTTANFWNENDPLKVLLSFFIITAFIDVISSMGYNAIQTLMVIVLNEVITRTAIHGKIYSRV